MKHTYRYLFLFALLFVGNVFTLKADTWYFKIIILFDQIEGNYGGEIYVKWDGGDTMCSFALDEENKVPCVKNFVPCAGAHPGDKWQCNIQPTVQIGNDIYTVVAIDADAFKNVKDLDFSALRLPNTIEEIGDRAFAGCNFPDGIYIPSSVKKIGRNAFSGTKGKLIANNSFDNEKWSICEYDENTEFGGDDVYLYFEGNMFSEIIIDEGVTKIGEGAFYESENLKTLKISNTVSFIDDCAFYGCENLAEVVIPNSVKVIEHGAFEECKSLLNIDLPDSLSFISESSLKNTGWYNEQPDGVLYLENYLLGYKGMFNQEQVKVLEGTRLIAEGALSWSRYVKNIDIPSSVTNICGSAFWMSNVRQMKLASSLLEFNGYAFAQTQSLGAITLTSPIPPKLVNGYMGCLLNRDYTYEIFTEDQYKNIELSVPAGSLEAYKNADVWKNFINIREEGGSSSIVEITKEGNDDIIFYDLNGFPTLNPKNGIYIRDGKKVYIR